MNVLSLLDEGVAFDRSGVEPWLPSKKRLLLLLLRRMLSREKEGVSEDGRDLIEGDSGTFASADR